MELKANRGHAQNESAEERRRSSEPGHRAHLECKPQTGGARSREPDEKRAGSGPSGGGGGKKKATLAQKEREGGEEQRRASATKLKAERTLKGENQ